MGKIILRLGVILSLLSFTSCYCWRSGSEHTRTCAIIKSTIDCAKGAIGPEVNGLRPLVAFLLEGLVPDWMGLLASLESVGIDVVACTAQAVNDDLTSQIAKLPDPAKMTATPEHAALRLRAGKSASNFETWKKTRLPNVEIKR